MEFGFMQGDTTYLSMWAGLENAGKDAVLTIRKSARVKLFTVTTPIENSGNVRFPLTGDDLATAGTFTGTVTVDKTALTLPPNDDKTFQFTIYPKETQ